MSSVAPNCNYCDLDSLVPVSRAVSLRHVLLTRYLSKPVVASPPTRPTAPTPSSAGAVIIALKAPYLSHRISRLFSLPSTHAGSEAWATSRCPYQARAARRKRILLCGECGTLSPAAGTQSSPTFMSVPVGRCACGRSDQFCPTVAIQRGAPTLLPSPRCVNVFAAPNLFK
jgi:hypothetical protein